MTHPTDQERAEDVAAKIADRFFADAPPYADHRTDLTEKIADALLSFAPQPSPSDEVRGLIERLRVDTEFFTDYGWIEQAATLRAAADVLARLSTPPVSGEGDEGPLWRHLKAIADQKLPEEIHGDLRPGADWKTGYIECVKIARFAVNSFAPDAPSRPPEAVASGERIIAWLVDGKVIDGSKYDPSKASFWLDENARQGATIIPLGPLTRPPEGNARALREMVKEAIDLLTERTQGSPARSAAHNARVRLESALALPVDDDSGPNPPTTTEGER